nr:hypothetical protein [bacterium]
MSHDIKKATLDEINRRLTLLRQHEHDRILPADNVYKELNQALSKAIGAPLIGELESLYEFIQNL